MLHRTTHPTPLTLISNVAVVAVVGLALYLTHELTALLGLLLVRELPFAPEELNVKIAEIQERVGAGDEDEELYGGGKMGFAPRD